MLKAKQKKERAAIASVAVTTAAIAFMAGMALSPQPAEGSGVQSGESWWDATPAYASSNDRHVHSWQASTKTIHHDAVTREVEHPDVVEDVTEVHTICNECSEIIDGHAEEHIEKTGHKGFTTGVPTSVRKVVKAAYTDDEIVEDAWDELVTTGYVCSECGAASSSMPSMQLDA